MNGQRFSYELEAARLRAGHRLEQAMQQVSAARRQLQQVEEARTALLEEVEQLGRSPTADSNWALVPQLSMARTDHLVRLRQRVAALGRTVEDRRQELTRALDEMRARSADRESFERHREQRLQQHLHVLAVRAAVAADHDWLARAAWRESRDSERSSIDPPCVAGRENA